MVTTLVAINSNGLVATSIDGVMWKSLAISPDFGGQHITDFAWSPELGIFVACITSVTSWSKDLVVWSIPKTGNGGKIIWCPELSLFIATNDNERTGNISISSDGENWAQYDTGHIAYSRMITWSAKLGIFLILDYYGFVSSSVDGINWIQLTNIGYQTVYDLIWVEEKSIFVIAGWMGIQTSSDGITWSSYYGTQRINEVVWSPELGIFVNVGGYGIQTSIDAINWITQDTSSYGINSLIWSSSLSLFISASSTGSVTSPDGITWTEHPSNNISYGPLIIGDIAPQGPSPIKIKSSSLSHGPRFETSPIQIESKSLSHGPKFNLAHIELSSSSSSHGPRFNLSPINVESSSEISAISGGDLSAYTGESSDILIPVALTGRLVPILPPPVPPVDFDGISDPTVAPILTKSDTDSGHLLDGTYQYSYAAWVGSEGQTTGPSPWSESITLTTDDTITLTYPTIPGADGYIVYRKEISE
jgi:hypothetical protein